jgi:hypothetical protein
MKYVDLKMIKKFAKPEISQRSSFRNYRNRHIIGEIILRIPSVLNRVLIIKTVATVSGKEHISFTH